MQISDSYTRRYYHITLNLEISQQSARNKKKKNTKQKKKKKDLKKMIKCLVTEIIYKYNKR